MQKGNKEEAVIYTEQHFINFQSANAMAEHNAVIYVYCDFNLRLPHGPKRLHAERFVLATLHNEGIHVCNGLCCGSLEQQNR